MASHPPVSHYSSSALNDDFKPSPREAFHTNPDLCRYMLRTVTSAVPLAIRSALVSMGSGLFVANAVEEGREIYRSEPMISCIDADKDTVCHFCLKDTTEIFKQNDDAPSQARACTGCKSARFCSKECQKKGWSKFHKEECKILNQTPKLRPYHLVLHRLLFWQRRKFISTEQGKALDYLETHFLDYSDDEDRATEIYEQATEIRDATRKKARMDLVWKLVPAMRTNCIPIRQAAQKESVGAALDLVTSVINHSCDPNAFVFFEGNQLRVRSLKKIAANEEITICYTDPTISVAMRQEILKRSHFFDCRCTRCRAEEREHAAILKDQKGQSSLEIFHQAQRDLVALMRSTALAHKYPGLHPDFENLGAVETQLRTISLRAFPASSWPDHIEPLPSSRLALAMFHLERGKRVSALRNALWGKLASHRRGGPEWVNEMLDVFRVLISLGSPPPPSPDEGLIPELIDIRTVAYGYLYELCKQAAKFFGGDSEYTMSIGNMYATVLEKTQTGSPKPGTEEFEKMFDDAQAKLMKWAHVPTGYGVVLSPQ